MKTITSIISQPQEEYQFPQPLNQILFFDIETTGLSPKASSLYLIGAMYYDTEHSHWTLHQWFADQYGSEQEMILAFLRLLEQYSFLYHFNGRTFDIPYLLHKCEKHHITCSGHAARILQDTSGEFSIDILAQIRPLKKLLGISKAGQTNLEQWLGISREDCYTGGELVSVYTRYMQKKILAPEESAPLEQLLLLHNHDDIAGMLMVCRILSYRRLLLPENSSLPDLYIQSVASVLSENSQPKIEISFSHGVHLPKAITLTKSYPVSREETSPLSEDMCCTLQLAENTGTITLPILKTELKFFFPDYKNYFYLPEEDQAVHKSIAEFVEKSHRRKATASTCYTKKTGTFLPSLSLCVSDLEVPVFFCTYHDKPAFLELPAEPWNPSDPFWNHFLLLQINAF